MANKSAKSAKWQFVTNHLISLPFIAQHVIDKKLVLSLMWLSFPLVRDLRFVKGFVILITHKSTRSGNPIT